MTSSEAQGRLVEWFRQWRAPLRKFLTARWGVQSGELDDVAQEVFLRLLRYDRTELVENPQAYLFKMASNVAAEWSMRARVRRPHDPKWLLDLRADMGPEDEAIRSAAHEQLRVALSVLPARQREVLRLHFGEGLSHAEIASRMAVTQRIVKRDLVKTYARLRTELDASVADTLRNDGGSHGHT
jgi:RNA polymerase sigma factor (sigma-70 family)